MKFCFQILLIIFILAPICIQTFGQNFEPKYIASLDSINGKEILSQCSRYTIEDYEVTFNLEKAEIDKLKINFKKIYKLESNDSCFNCFSWDKSKRLNEFAYQIVGVKIGGRKYIYISAFLIRDISLRSEPILRQIEQPLVMCDGGASFWGVYYDIDRNQFEQLSYNGNGSRQRN